MNSVDLAATPHVVHRWWARGDPGDIGHAVIGLGQLEDSRWFVAKAEHGTNMAWLARDERHAAETIQRWIMRRGRMELWREVAPPQGRPSRQPRAHDAQPTSATR